MRVVFTDIDHSSIETEKKILSDAGVDFTIYQCRTEADVIKNCGEAEILINQYAPITASVMDALPKCKLVIRYGVGVDNVSVKDAVERGITVCNIPDYGTAEVADHALALMLSLTRKIGYMSEQTKTKAWDCSRAFPIRRSSVLTVGIIGFGRIGQAFAHRVNALGCNIIACDHHLAPNEAHPCGYVIGATMDEIIEKSDVISIHCPPEKGHYMIDAAAISRMKDGVYIINDARGGIIDEEALDAALESGKVAGAALDCMMHEPVAPYSGIFRHKNLVVTPHMGWYSEEAAVDLKRKVAEQAVKFIKSGKVDYPVFKN